MNQVVYVEGTSYERGLCMYVMNQVVLCRGYEL